MTVPIDGRPRELLEGPNFGHLAALRKDGSPYIVSLWVDVEGDLVLLNTAEGRLWPRLVRRDPRVTLQVADAANPYEFVQFRGRVVDETPDGALEHIHKLAGKYMGEERYPFLEPDERRLLVRVEVDAVGGWDPTRLGPAARAYLAARS